MKSSKNELVLVLTNEASSLKARELGEKILNKRLAACINFSDINSIYWWQGKLEKSKEIQMIIKTRNELLDEIINFIGVNHSYQTPEIISLDVLSDCDYFSYVSKNLRL